MLKSGVMLLPSLGKPMTVIYLNRVHLTSTILDLLLHTDMMNRHNMRIKQLVSVLGYSLPDHLTQLIHILKQHVVVSHGPKGIGDSSLLTLSPGKSVKTRDVFVNEIGGCSFVSIGVEMQIQYALEITTLLFTVFLTADQTAAQMIIPKNANDTNRLTS